MFLFSHRSETAAEVCKADGVPCTNDSVEFCFSISWGLSKYLYSFTQMEMCFLGYYICTCLNQKMRCGYAVGTVGQISFPLFTNPWKAMNGRNFFPCTSPQVFIGQSEKYELVMYLSGMAKRL